MTAMQWVWLVAMAVTGVVYVAWFTLVALWIVKIFRRRLDEPLRPMPWSIVLVLPGLGIGSAAVRLWVYVRTGGQGWLTWFTAVDLAAWSLILVAFTLVALWSRRVAREVAAIRAETGAVTAGWLWS